MRLAPILTSSLSLLCLPLWAQLHDAPFDARDEGTWEGCGPSLQVHFTDSITGMLTYQFTPQVDPGEHVVYGCIWSVYDGEFQQTYAPDLTHTFPVPGEHLVCLTVQAQDLTAAPCSTTTCHLLPILQDTSCATLEVDFTLAGVAGYTVTFYDQTVFPPGIAYLSWDFGEAFSTSTTPQHTFSGSGPHRICLTATGVPPVGCVATTCKWLYLGPVPVPCADLFIPGFLMVQHEDLVGVLDTSVTSGMSREVLWDFGDGSPLDEGRFAVHGYTQDGVYELCSTVRFWGPLVSDTCSVVHCMPVLVMTALGQEEIADREEPLRAHPVPFDRHVMLTGLATGGVLVEMFDASGKLMHQAWHTEHPAVLLDLSHLHAGPHVLRCTQGRRARSIRVVKE